MLCGVDCSWGCACEPDGGAESDAPEWLAFGSPYQAEPGKAKLLNEYGDFALFVGETERDAAFNAEVEWGLRNSLFLRQRVVSGRDK